MRYDLILKNGTLVTPEKTFEGGIAVKDGKIAVTGALEPSADADEIYDADGLHILPGIIDAHVHFREPGLTEKEDFETGSIAAAFGGVTMVADMPNVIPVTSTVERFNEKVRIAQESSFIDFGLFALANNTTDLEGLKKAGALGYKIFLGNSTGDIAAPDAGTLFEIMKESARLGMRVGFHAENSELNSHFTSLCMKDRDTRDTSDTTLLSRARPVISEALAIQYALCFAQYTGAGIHIHHVTSSDGARLVAEAKKNGIPVTAETCPHYLLLDCGADASVKVYPPIREKDHRISLWDALGKGVIDMIASDHAPHTAAEKAKSLWEAPAGICGVETSVRLMLNEVNKGNLSLNGYVRLASEAPAKIWGIYPRKGNLLPGTDADFTVVDMKKRSVIRTDELHSKSKTCVYDGTETQGLPAAVIVRGRFVMRDGELTGGKGRGVLLP
ncbi:MAG: dihydroorotase family protein [Treponema sp.]|jgi:dihydroorotase|nr:dihydroorotase family protein [Treponema sp.]